MNSPSLRRWVIGSILLAALAIPVGARSQTQVFELPLYAILNKTEAYEQSSPDVPILQAHQPVAIVYNVLAGFTLLSARVTAPAGTPIDLVQDPSIGVEIPGLTATEPFDSASDLAASYPAGNYRVTVAYAIENLVSSQVTLEVPFPDRPFPPIPRALNYADAQCIDPTREFTLEVAAFTGGTDLDQAALQIYRVDDPTNVVHSISLTPTHTGPLRFLIPAGTLSPQTEYTARVLYDGLAAAAITNQTHLGGVIQVPFLGRSSFARANRFKVFTGDCPRLTAVRAPESPDILVQFNSQPGQTYAIESSPDLLEWREIGSTNAAGPTVAFRHPRNTEASSEFLRVVTR